MSKSQDSSAIDFVRFLKWRQSWDWRFCDWPKGFKKYVKKGQIQKLLRCTWPSSCNELEDTNLKYHYGNPAQDTLTLAPLFQIVLRNYASFSESFLCISVVQQYHTTAVLNCKPRPLCPLFLRLYAFMWGWKTQLKNNDWLQRFHLTFYVSNRHQIFGKADISEPEILMYENWLQGLTG